MKEKFIYTLLALFICTSLSACGKRGGPFPPKDQVDTFGQQYPKTEPK